MYDPIDLARAIGDVTRDDILYTDKKFGDIGVDEDFTSYLHKLLDPDGSKYGGNADRLKEGFLNDRTFRANSITAQAVDFARSSGMSQQQKIEGNLMGRLYESAPNRLLSGNLRDTTQALKSGLAGAVIGPNGADLALNLLLTPAVLARVPVMGIGNFFAQGAANVAKNVLGKEVVQESLKDGASAAALQAAKEGITGFGANSAKWAAVKQGAAQEAAINAPLSVGADALEQLKNENYGLQDEYSVLQGASAALLGGGVGGAFGGVMNIPMGARVGREMVGEAPLRNLRVPEGQFPPTLAGERARMAAEQAQLQAGTAGGAGSDVMPGFTDADFAAQFNSSKQDIADRTAEAAKELEQRANEIRRGSLTDTVYSAETVSQMANVLGRMNEDPQVALRHQQARLAKAQATGDTDAMGAARTQGEMLTSLYRWIDNNPDGFSETSTSIPEQLVDVLSLHDSRLAALVGRDRAAAEKAAASGGAAPGAASTTPPGPTGPAGPAAPKPAGGQSVPPAQPAAPPQGTGGAAPPQAPTQPSAGPTTTVAPDGTVTTQAAGPAPAAAPEPEAPAQPAATPTKVEDLEPTLNDKEKAAVSALRDLAAKAQTTIDEVIQRLDGGTPATEVAADLAARAGAEPPQANQIVSTAAVSVQRGRKRAAAQAPAGAAAPEAPPAAAGAATPEAAPSATPEEAPTPTPEEPMPEGVDESMVADAMRDQVATHFNVAHLTLQQNLTDAVEALDMADITPERLAALKADPDTGALWAGVEMPQLASEKGRAEIKARMGRDVRRAFSSYVADSVSRVMPDALNVGHFERLLTLFPGLSETVRREVVEDYTKMARSALAEEVGHLGSVEAVISRYGKVAEDLLSKTPARKKRAKKNPTVADQMAALDAESPLIDSVDLKAIVEPLPDGARQFVTKQLRDFKKQLEASPIRLSPELMDAALRRRVDSAFREYVDNDWAKKNPDDARRLAALKSMRETNAMNRARARSDLSYDGWDDVTDDDLMGQIVNVEWSGTVEGSQGSRFENPLVERIRPGSKWGKIVQGRVQERQLDGTVALTSSPQGPLAPTVAGSSFFGSLFANPRRVVAAGARHRTEIHMAGIARAGEMSKRKLGLAAETINQRVAFARMQAIISQQRKRMAGEISEDDFAANIQRISDNSSNKVLDEEIAAAADFLNMKDQIDKSHAAAKAKMSDVMETLAAGGLDADDVVVKIFTDMRATMSKIGPRFLASVERLSDPTKAKVEARRKAAASKQEKAEKKSKVDPSVHVIKPNPEPQATVSVKTADGVVRELRPDAVAFNPDRTITLFGEKVGKWHPHEDDKRVMAVFFDGYTGPAMQPVVDAADLLKRKSFQRHFSKKLESNKEQMPKADTRVVDEPGEVVPENASRAKEIDDAVAEVKQGSLTAEQMNTPFSTMQLPEGRRWVILDRANGNYPYRVTERMATPAQVVGSKLGQGDFVLGTVPIYEILPNGKKRGAHSNEAFVKSKFVPHGRDTGTPDQRVLDQIKVDEQNKGVLPEILKARRGPVDMKTLEKIPAGEGMSAAQLVTKFDELTIRLRLDDMPTRASHEALLEQLGAMASKLEEIVPHGVDRPNVSRRTAVHWLRTHLRGSHADDIQAAVDFLRRLDVDPRGMPYFERSPVYAEGTVVEGVDVSGRTMSDHFSSATNKIRLDGDKGTLVNAQGQLVFPRHLSVIHESAHWAYVNLLSPKERVEFVRALGKYFEGDKFNREKFFADLPGANELQEATGKSLIGGTNGANELFAWQFTSWYLQKARGTDVAGEESLWKRVVHYVKNLLHKMIGRTVDPDLAPLFERIMPSSPMESRFDYGSLRDLRGENKVVGTEAAMDERHGEALKKLDAIKRLDEFRRKLDEHLFDPTGFSPDGLAEDLKSAGTHLFLALYPNKKDGKFNTNAIMERLSYALVGGSNPDPKKTKEMFGRSGTGAIMDAYNRIRVARVQADALDRADPSVAFDDFVDDVTTGIPGKVMLANYMSDPEARAMYIQELEAAYKAAKVANPMAMENDLLDIAEIAADAALRREYRIDSDDPSSPGMYKAADFDQENALRAMANDVRDMLMDGMDSLASFVENDGYAVVRNRRHVRETPKAPDEVAKSVSDEVAKEAERLYTTGQKLVDAGDTAKGQRMMDTAVGRLSAAAPKVEKAAEDDGPASWFTLARQAADDVAEATKGKSGAEYLKAEQAVVAGYYDRIRDSLRGVKDIPETKTKYDRSINTIGDIDELEGELRSAIATGDTAGIVSVERRMRELERVGKGKADVGPDNSPTAMNLRVLDSEIARESAAPSDLAPGIPPLTNPQLKTLLSRVTHRQHAVRDVSRRAAYRLLKLLRIEEPTNTDLARIMEADVGTTNPEGLAVGGKLAKDFAATMRDFSQIALGRVEEDGTKLDASDFAGQIARMIYSAKLATPEFQARLAALGPEIGKVVNRDSSGFKTVQDLVQAIASEFYAGSVLRRKDLLKFNNVLENAPNAMAMARELAEEARWVVEGAISAKSEPGANHLGVLGVPVGKGQHPAFAMRRVSEMLDAVGPDGLADIGAKIGISGTDASMARIARSVLFHQPGRGSRVGLLGPNGIQLSSVPDVNLASREAERLARGLGEEEGLRARILIDSINNADRQMMDRSLSPSDLRRLARKRDAALTVLRNQIGSDFSDAVTPVLVDVERLLDLSIQDNKMPLAVVARSYAKAVGNPEALTGLADIVRAGDARKLYDLMTSTIGKKEADALLKDAGYVGVRDGGGVEVFDAASVKSLDEAMNFDDRAIPESEIDRQPLGGELFLGMVEGGGERKVSSAGAQSRALASGMSEAASAALSKIVPGSRQRLNDNDVRAISKFGGWLQISSNPARMRKVGATFLADLTESFFQARNPFLGKHLAPVIRAIDKVSGAGTMTKKYLQEIKRHGSVWTDSIPQTEAETRIANAMREGATGVAKLNPEERAVASQLQSFFQRMLAEQNAAGLKIGDIAGLNGGYYLPQRLNIDRLRADPEAAIKAFTRFFQKDRGGDASGAAESARRMVGLAMDDWQFGGYLGGSTYAASFGEANYQRILRAEPADMAYLGEFFDNNLKSLVIGYAQSAANRIEVSKRFGLGEGGHVLGTYLDVAMQGTDAARDALLQRRTFVPTKVKQDIDGKSVTFPVDLYQPLTQDAQQAAQIIEQVKTILSGQGNPQAMRKAASEYLTTMYEAEGVPGVENFRKAADAIVNGLAEFTMKGKSLDGEEARWMQGMVHHLAGRPAYMSGVSKGAQKFSGGLMNFNNVTLLSTAVLSSLPDIGMSLFRSGSIGAWGKAFAQTLRYSAQYDSAFKTAQRELGVTIESILNENVTDAHGGKMGRFNNAFFWATGLTPWTNAMREMAAATGYQSIKANQEMLKRLRSAQQTDTAKYRRGMRYLRELGVAHLIDAPAMKSFEADVGVDDRLREALHKFTNEAVFQPNKNDIPLWAQDPLGKLAFQFKSYPLMLGRMMKRSFNEAVAMERGNTGESMSWGEIIKGGWRDSKYAGDPRPLTYLLTIGAALGAGSQYTRDVLLGRNQDAAPGEASSDWHSSRERLISKILEEMGLEALAPDSEEADAALGWYTEGLIGLGALGMVGDLVYQSAASIDNGAYGQQRMASLFLGPWMGTFFDTLNVAAGGASAATDLLSEDGGTNSKERLAVRELLQRVPVAGRVQSFTETGVDFLAGEAQTAPPSR
jgi:hypothetical protein